MNFTIYMMSYNSTIHETCPLTFMAYNYSELQGKLQNIFFSHSDARCLRTTVTLYGCHNGNFFLYSLYTRKLIK
jgi:hypothetical protein